MSRPAPPLSFDDSFELLYRRAYLAAFRVLGQRPLAEDCALETLARAWSRWSSIADHSLPWVVSVSGRLAVDEWRRGRHRTPARIPPEQGSADLAVLRADLQRGLSKLTRRQREAAVLRYLGDLAEEEVAERMACSPGTVKQHARRALARLRPLMADGAAAETTEEVDDVPAS